MWTVHIAGIFFYLKEVHQVLQLGPHNADVVDGIRVQTTGAVPPVCQNAVHIFRVKHELVENRKRAEKGTGINYNCSRAYVNCILFCLCDW